MPTINLQVNSSTDDARNIDGLGTGAVTVQTQHIGKFNDTTIYWNGFVWTNVAIPQGATITSALITLYSANVHGGALAKSRWWGEDVDSAATLGGGTARPEPRIEANPTTAYVDHDFTIADWGFVGWGTGDQIDVTPIVQEIIDRVGWTSGNSIHIAATDNGSADTNYLSHSTYDRATDRGAKLDITYEVGSASVSPSLSPSSSVSPSTAESSSVSPSESPSVSPSSSVSPSESPSRSPSLSPSSSVSPSVSPSISPSSSISPSLSPSSSKSPSSSVSPSLSPSSSKSPSSSISPSVSPSSSVSPSNSPSLSPSSSVSPSQSPSNSPSLSPSSSISPSQSPSVSPSISPSSSVSPSEVSSESSSVSPSSSPSLSPSSSVSPSVSPSPSPGYQEYTRGDYAVLPTDDTDLETGYIAQDYLDVETKNDVRVAQTALEQFMIHQFKDYVGIETVCTLECELQATLAPSSSTVYLQIYNRDTSSWTTVDSDSASSANTDFILTANIADLTDYKDTNNVISCRVYQEAT